MRRLVQLNDDATAGHAFHHQLYGESDDDYGRGKRDVDGSVRERHGSDYSGQSSGYQRNRGDREPNGNDDLHTHRDSFQRIRGHGDRDDHGESRANDHQLRGESHIDPCRGSSSLTAVFANGTGVITPGNLAVTSGTAVSVSPTVTTTYTLTVTPAAGTALTQQATVTVYPAPIITSFQASKSGITAGESVSLTAVFTGGTGVITPGNLAVTSGNAVTVTPSTTTTYTLTVTPPVGAAITATVTVTVDAAPTIASFVASPTTVGPGGSASLTGVFANGTGVITPGNIPVTSGAPVSVTPSATTTYTLTVTNPFGTAITGTTTVTYNASAPAITTFNATPATIGAGSSSSLLADFVNGTGVITPGNIAVTTGTPVNVSPTTTTVYTLTVTPTSGTAVTQTVDCDRGSSADDHEFWREPRDDHFGNKLQPDGSVCGRHGCDHARQSDGDQRDRRERKPDDDNCLYAHGDSNAGHCDHADHYGFNPEHGIGE